MRGRIDALVLQDQLWVLVIESQRAEFSPRVGIPQLLTDMLATPDPALSCYGLVTNGTDFIFLKLRVQEVPRYARSRQFVLEQENDLERVLQILKHLAILGAFAPKPPAGDAASPAPLRSDASWVAGIASLCGVAVRWSILVPLIPG